MISNVHEYTKKPNLVQQVNILNKYCHCFRSRTLEIRPDRYSLNYLSAVKFNMKIFGNLINKKSAAKKKEEKISIESMKDPIHPN